MVLLIGCTYVHAESKGVPVNSAVTNPSLSATINRLKTNPSASVQSELSLELNKATYLLATSNKNITTTPVEGGLSTTNEGSSFELFLTSDDEGNIYLPLYTDCAALRKDHGDQADAVAFSADYVWYFMLEVGKYHGIVVVSEAGTIPLSKEHVQYLSSQSTNN